MSTRVSFIWLLLGRCLFSCPSDVKRRTRFQKRMSPWVLWRRYFNVSWPCIYGTLYLQSCTQEILEEMFCGFSISNSLDNDPVHQANKAQCCSEMRTGRGFSTERWPPTQTWRETWGLPIVFPHECCTGPNAKRHEPPLLTSGYV